MKIFIDNKLYYKYVNMPVGFRKKLSNILSKVWPCALTFVMFYGLAVLGLRCF